MNIKIMSGKDVISRLSFEQYFADCKKVLVICDLWAEICGAKRKIKKAFGKHTKLAFAKVQASSYAEVATLDNCLQKFKEVQADMIVCAGSQIACNLGKAIKYISSFNVGSFEDFCKLKFENESYEGVQKTQIGESAKLVHLVTASGDHSQLLTGAFELFDKKKNTFYKFCKKEATPDVVMVEQKLLDKLSIIGLQGVELGTLAMGLIVLANSEEDADKINARAAINILGGQKPSFCDLYVAEMSAGYGFFGLKNNLLQELVFAIQTKTNLLYFQVLILLLKNSFQKLVDKLDNEDIKLLGNPYDLGVEDIDGWREAFGSLIQTKIDKYFDDKDVISCLNEAGLNSEDIEDIFAELIESFGQSELLTALKDLTYAGY